MQSIIQWTRKRHQRCWRRLRIEVDEILDGFRDRGESPHGDGRLLPLRVGGVSIRRALVSSRLQHVASHRRRPITQRLFVLGVEVQQTRNCVVPVDPV